MAKSDKPEDKSTSETSTPAPSAAAITPPAPMTAPMGPGGPLAGEAPQQLRVHDADLQALYANFCRVTGTPEELIIDFGLNPQPFGVPADPIEVSQRIVTNFYTAKRLWQALQMTLQRHEAAFGILETDVQKRVMPSMRGPQT